jgi:hypothetical protein
MEVSVSNRCVPADDDIVADLQLLLAEQERVREVAPVANSDPRLGTKGKMNSVHCAVAANRQRRVEGAAKPMESVVPNDQRVPADTDVRRKMNRIFWGEIWLASRDFVHGTPREMASIEAPC